VHPHVSVLFNEPKLLKLTFASKNRKSGWSFSALQRAEIAEIVLSFLTSYKQRSFSALQRAEIAEIERTRGALGDIGRFSALQRAEIAEMDAYAPLDFLLLEFQCSSTSRNC